MAKHKDDQTTRPDQAEDARGNETAIYVYAVIPSAVQTSAGTKGVGDPPRAVTLIKHDGIAALVSEIPLGSRLGTSEDLTAHARIVDGAAEEVAVLPLRFGALLANRDAVVDELLAPHAPRFEASLKILEGLVQYVVKGRYLEEAILPEVLDANPQARQLRERIARLSGESEASRPDRIALGELIGQGIEAARTADTKQCAHLLDEAGARLNYREPTHEFDAVQLACLVQRDRVTELHRAVERFARDQEGRIRMRMLGPMAAYDFVDTEREG